MKILSIRQPWAHLIVHGAKNIENRTWPSKYRGPFLIHASLNVNSEASREHGFDPAELQTGGVVGIAEITDCVEDHRSKVRGTLRVCTPKSCPLPFVRWTGSLALRDAPARLLKRLGLRAAR
jgi:hypothetical protein